MLTIATFIQHSIGRPSHSNKTRKRNKGYPDWKGRSKTISVDRLHNTIHKKILRKSQRHLANSKFKNLQDTKSTYKNQFYFCILIIQQSKNEIKKTTPFTIASKSK